MKLHRLFQTALFGAVFGLSQAVMAGEGMAGSEVKKLDEDQAAHKDCAGCHVTINPGIVKQHLDSPHANPKKAEVEVRCHDCHGTAHNTMEDHAKAEMPTADTCGECHKKQAKQHKAGKHNLGWLVMKSQIAWHGQPGAITEEGYRGCSGCHKIGEKGLIGVTDGNTGAVKKDNGEEAAKYRYGNAQCDACHTRHTFKTSEAKDPRACSNCHMGFDHPQWEMYSSSKHGVIWGIEGHEEDARAPTCQGLPSDGRRPRGEPPGVSWRCVFPPRRTCWR